MGRVKRFDDSPLGQYFEKLFDRLIRNIAKPIKERKPMLITGEKIEPIAKVCHEANRAYYLTIGDRSQLPWEGAPEWQKDSAKKGVMFHLEHLQTAVSVPPSASHDSWLAQKRAEGWKYGPTKDPEKKEHPQFLPYNELPAEQRMKDYLFGAIVKAFFDCAHDTQENRPEAKHAAGEGQD